MGVFGQNIHKAIYFWGIVLLAVAIPLSEFVMSVATLILSVNWLIEGGMKTKLLKIVKTRSILMFLGFLLIHVIWLINTNDFDYAIRDIKVKLPILAMPVILGTSGLISSKQTKILILFFVASVTASSLISTSILLGIYDHPINTLRDISIFISHIRFSLMIVFSIFILLYLLLFSKEKLPLKEKIIYIIVAIWLLVFLYLLQALSGLLIFTVISIILLFIWTFRLKQIVLKLSFLLILLTLISAGAHYIYNSIISFYDIEVLSDDDLWANTKQGNKYWHVKENKSVENGHYTYYFICEKELEESWNEKSEYKYYENDKQDQPVKYTLIRYLTSKGLRKDAEGVSKLSNEDIANIENGIANYKFASKYSLDAIIYKLIWEIDIYLKTNDPSNNTLTQRIEYLRAAKEIIKNNFWFGTGTGDVKAEFKKQYEIMNSKLDDDHRRRAHNQYATFLLTFGIFGFLLVVITMFYPYFLHKDKHHILFTIFLLIVFFSMINEDTLETQPGNTFYAYFYCLFLYTWNKESFLSKTNQRK